MAASHDQFISPAEAARRLGVSVRALRLYERRGLLSPLRTSNGWRAYGPDQIARIQEILALKGLGLSLARIGELLAGRGEVGLDQVLASQQGLLAARRGQLDRALVLVGAARARIATGASVTANDLIDLIRETTMSEQAWATAIKPFYDRHFDAAELDAMRAASAPITETWQGLIAELSRLAAAHADPVSSEATEFFDRWMSQSLKTTGGDTSLFAKGRAAWGEALADPELAPKLPIGPAELAFLGQAARSWQANRPRA